MRRIDWRKHKILFRANELSCHCSVLVSLSVLPKSFMSWRLTLLEVYSQSRWSLRNISVTPFLFCLAINQWSCFLEREEGCHPGPQTDPQQILLASFTRMVLTTCQNLIWKNGFSLASLLTKRSKAVEGPLSLQARGRHLFYTSLGVRVRNKAQSAVNDELSSSKNVV